MCDTMVALTDSTAGSCVLFAKNSDRQRNEAQVVERLARADHPRAAVVNCTYISVPQVGRTHAVLLCRPYWIWGAEMGANECGVVIGNEALRAQVPAPETVALTGMDLVRLALERASSSVEAVDVMTQLLEAHGQGGDCGP
jgi:secernin